MALFRVCMLVMAEPRQIAVGNFFNEQPGLGRGKPGELGHVFWVSLGSTRNDKVSENKVQGHGRTVSECQGRRTEHSSDVVFVHSFCLFHWSH